MREQGIAHIRFQRMPTSTTQVIQFFQWLRELLYYNPCSHIKDMSLIVELKTINMPLAWKYFSTLCVFLQTEEQNQSQHTTRHVRTCLVTSYSGIYRVFLKKVVTSLQTYPPVSWHHTVEDAVKCITKAQTRVTAATETKTDQPV